MRKKSLVIATLILLVILAGFAYLFITSSASEEEASMQQQQTQSEPETLEPTSTPVQPGAYLPYDQEAVSKAIGTKILFFHAPWCPQCRDLDKDITAKGVPDGVLIFKVDYDTNQTLRKKYGVTLQTTFVLIDDEGKLVKKVVAYDEPTFETVKDALL